ncbi:MAG TPA: carbohydrate kinase [Flavisolibacter sp.]|nr:carbohydrate kinase [Flavisolibacter sp.]
MKILCIGEALIDMICTDTGRTLAEGEHFLKKPGGAPTNVAAAIAALGGDVMLAAKVGDDPFGHQLIDLMQKVGVDTSHMLMDKEFFTTIAFVSLLPGGERDFVFSRGADGQLSEDDVSSLKLEDYSVVHFGSATAFLPGPLQKAYVKLMQEARKNDVFISFDPNYRHLLYKDIQESYIEQSWTFLKSCHFFKMSDEEALLLTKQESLDEAVAILAEGTSATFAVTLGKEGTLVVYADNREIIPSIPVQAIDSTGAGDAFVGAMLYQLRHASLKEIQAMGFDDWKVLVANANKAGARTCEYMGAMEAFQHLNNTIFD